MQLTEALGWFYLSMEAVKSKQTIIWYRHRLFALAIDLEDPTLASVTLNELRQWRVNLSAATTRWDNHPTRPIKSGGLSPYTIHGYIRAAKRFFTWCVDEGYIDVDPARRLESPSLPTLKRRGIPTKDRDKLISAAADNPRDLAIILFLTATVCRAAGIAGLRLGDLDLEHTRALVREKGRGGNNKIRTVYFKDRVLKALCAWLAVRPDIPDCDLVFIGLKRGGLKAGWHGLTTSGVYQIFKRLANLAGVTANYDPHSFRHAGIRAMLMNGAPLSSVSQIAGHSSVKVTADIYGTLSDEELQVQHDNYSPF